MENWKIWKIVSDNNFTSDLFQAILRIIIYTFNYVVASFALRDILLPVSKNAIQSASAA